MGKGNSDFKISRFTAVKHAPFNSEEIMLEDNLKTWQLPDEHASVFAAIKVYILKARDKFHLSETELPMPSLSYKLRGNILGKATFHRQGHTLLVFKVSINPIYLEAYRKEIIEDTIPHEIGHLVAYLIHGTMIYPHGREWQNVCLDLGHYPSVTCKGVDAYKRVKQQVERQVGNQINGMSADDF